MKNKIPLVTLPFAFVLLVLNTGCAGRVRVGPAVGQPLGPTTAVPGQTPLPGPVTAGLPAGPEVVNGACGADLDRIARSFSGGLIGSVVVARGGQILLAKGYGVSPDALWDWASVSKQFTAAGMLKLQMQGRLKIDDPIAKFYPRTPADKQGITLRHILSHTSGISHSTEPDGTDPSLTRDGLIDFFMRQPMAAAPGTKFDYNNTNFELAAAVIEQVAGQPFESWMIQNLFRPAGMKTATYLGQPDVDASRVPRGNRGQGEQFPYTTRMCWGYRGSAGAILPAREFLIWDQALRGDSILDAASKQELYRVQLEDYALGWGVLAGGSDTFYEHQGSIPGFSTTISRGRDTGIVIAIATSLDDAKLEPLEEQLVVRALRP